MTPDQWDRVLRIEETLGIEAALAKAFQFGKRDGGHAEQARGRAKPSADWSVGETWTCMRVEMDMYRLFVVLLGKRWDAIVKKDYTGREVYRASFLTKRGAMVAAERAARRQVLIDERMK